jgi:hypothetical protein
VSGTDIANNQFGDGNDTLFNALLGIVNASATNFDFGAGADAFTNNALFNTAGTVNFLNLESIGNNAVNGQSNGIFNVGATPGGVGQVNFSSTDLVGAAFAAVGAPVQNVVNSGVYNVLAVQAQVGTYQGSLNFYGGNGSNFFNYDQTPVPPGVPGQGSALGGLINMQRVDNSSTANAVTLNTLGMTGTSDANYTYTWAGPLATSAYNFTGGPNSRLAVDTFLGAPGSTSDRLVVGGNVNLPVTVNGSSTNPVTRINVNDTNAGPGAFNPLGITVVAVQGAGSNNFVVDPLSPHYANFGPLGAISKGLFLYPLLYVPGGATTANAGQPDGNAYKFFGVPGPFAFNLPVAATGAQTIFQETADGWEDRQIEVRNCMDRGLIASRQAWGSGADLAVPPAAPLLPNCGVGIWTKLVGSATRRDALADLSKLDPLFAGLTFDNSYRQRTEAVLAGMDFGAAELTSPFDSIVFSVMGGYISSFLDFNSPNTFSPPITTTSFKYTGGTVGGSVTYMNHGFFVDALVKADFLTLNVGGIPAGSCAGPAECDQDIKALTWGVVGNVGYRFQVGRYFFEPLGSVIWTQTRIDDLNLPGAGVVAQFNTAKRIDVGGGARLGGVVMDDRVHYLEASFTGRFWDRISSDDNSVTFLNQGPAFTLTDTFKNAYVETAVQLDWINRFSGWSSWAKVDAKFNSELQTYTAKAGLRYGF